MAKKIEKTENQIISELIHDYISDWECYYPNLKHNSCGCDMYRRELEKFGTTVIDKLNIEKIKHIAFRTENEELKKVLTKRYVGKIKESIFKHNNPQSLVDFCYFLEALKHDNKNFKNIEIDYLEFSQAIAATNDLNQNMNWAEYRDENKANINMLLKSGDPLSLSFLVRYVKLTKEQLDYCVNTVIESQDAEAMLYTSYADVIDKTTYERLRKAIVKTKNLDANEEFLSYKNVKLNKTQIKQHKKVIFESQDKNKYSNLVVPMLKNPEYFTEEEKEEIINGIIESKDKNSAAYIIDGYEALTDKQLEKLTRIILKNKSSDFFARIITKIEARNNKNKDKIVAKLKNKQEKLIYEQEQKELKFIQKEEEIAKTELEYDDLV